MRAINRYIAFVLFILYTIPVIYQNLHVIQHHTVKNYASAYQKGHIEGQSGISIIQKDDHCFVCDFTFFLNIVHPVRKIFAQAFNFTERIFITAIDGKTTPREDSVTPRAPPVI